ncbi:MAG: ExbD/TolR family protein [Pseudomonadales bacterium]
MNRFKPSQSTTAEELDVDLTSMLDVVFIMLIFFIVTASFVREVGIDVTRPAGDAQKKVESIVFNVTSSGEIWLKGRRIDALSVRANVERILAELPNAGVVVSADESAKTAAFASVIDAAREAGAANVALVTSRGS